MNSSENSTDLSLSYLLKVYLEQCLHAVITVHNNCV